MTTKEEMIEAIEEARAGGKSTIVMVACDDGTVRMLALTGAAGLAASMYAFQDMLMGLPKPARVEVATALAMLESTMGAPGSGTGATMEADLPKELMGKIDRGSVR